MTALPNAERLIYRTSEYGTFYDKKSWVAASAGDEAGIPLPGQHIRTSRLNRALWDLAAIQCPRPEGLINIQERQLRLIATKLPEPVPRGDNIEGILTLEVQWGAFTPDYYQTRLEPHWYPKDTGSEWELTFCGAGLRAVGMDTQVGSRISFALQIDCCPAPEWQPNC